MACLLYNTGKCLQLLLFNRPNFGVHFRTRPLSQRVSQLSGIGPDEPIGIPSDRPARWISVARAMAIQENGTAQIDDFAMLKGFDLARQDAK